MHHSRGALWGGPLSGSAGLELLGLVLVLQLLLADDDNISTEMKLASLRDYFASDVIITCFYYCSIPPDVTTT